MTISEADLIHLRRAIELARKALDAGDGPFGSVLVDAAGIERFADRNREVTNGDATRHPEFEIARWAATNLTAEERAAATVYTPGGALPDVLVGARMGRARPDRLRRLRRADRRMARGTWRPILAGRCVAGHGRRAGPAR